MSLYIFLLLTLLTSIAFQLGRMRALRIAARSGGLRKLHSLPRHYGSYMALRFAVPAFILAGLTALFADNIAMHFVWNSLPEQLRILPEEQAKLLRQVIIHTSVNPSAPGSNASAIVQAGWQLKQLTVFTLRLGWAGSLLIGTLSAGLFLKKIDSTLPARLAMEKFMRGILAACTGIVIFTTFAIIASVAMETFRFFQFVSPVEFFFGHTWSPQTAMHAGQVGASGHFGALPVIGGTLMITLTAMLIAVPTGLLTAIYFSEYASSRRRQVLKPILETLAGIPTVVYGFFAVFAVGPFIGRLGLLLDVETSTESALAAGVVIGIMIIPYISSLSDDAIHAVPKRLREGSRGLGATRSETILHIVLPAAMPGIIGSLLLALSRAAGETMIVVMAAGMAGNFSFNPLKSATTVTVQMVNLVGGAGTFNTPSTLAAFALGLLLFLFTLTVNIIALHIVRRYHARYQEGM
ncbi:phosphate ABC transporter permease subunit PstC [Desulforhopalus vacuolatus]|uniref:phosphate ABC transporter permease subunit PstC n=1 Tax=Desulforhopalus vacuolatus TaxID=40414 RepID=UPI00196686B2|nr:phosphate ABC transporter permease subunit PstC [Desulforhopalus vacuolatus]MBM9518777.1 phosphate ABC transporter permease subunit PstC [Desulforhopalus vacuolatus]